MNSRPVPDSFAERVFQYLVALGILSYTALYLLVPDAYAIGPLLLTLLAVIGFRWQKLKQTATTEDVLFISAFAGYFLVLAALNLIHGTDGSEYDLPSRFLAGALAAGFLLRYTVPARLFFLAAALGAGIAGILAVYQVFGLGVGRVSTFDNPVHYGNGALALAAISACGIIWASTQRRRYAWILFFTCAAALGLLACLYSGTRSGWVAIPVLILVTGFAFSRTLMRHKGVAAASLVIVVILILGVLQTRGVERRIEVGVQEFKDYFEKDRNGTSVGLRLDMWKSGLHAFQENPLVGAGPVGYEDWEKELIETGEVHKNIASFRHLHNQYVDALARGGLIRLAALLYLFIVPLVLFLSRVRHHDPEVKALALAGALFMGAHVVFNLTQSMLERNIGVMMFVFMPIFIWSMLSQRERSLRKASV